MKFTSSLILLIWIFCDSIAQQIDTFLLDYPVSKNSTIIYKRIIEHDLKDEWIHVRDYLPSGQIQMDAHYSKFDKNVKELLQCNYHSNTKEGLYKEWYDNGQLMYLATFRNGLRDGQSESWYKDGLQESEENWTQGKLDGHIEYWAEDGSLQYNLEFRDGSNINPSDVTYHYIDYLPSGYSEDSTKKWPVIIFLHGGSARGADTLDLYDYGPFDQIYRGREFPFIIVAPQCPKSIRWSTENWFGNFYDDLINKYRIDTNRIYLTGSSLGGSGTWFLAIKYPDRFAAIAPMSGFTRHMDYITENLENLKDIPIWAFHGSKDTVVPVEDTDYLIEKLRRINQQVEYTRDEVVGHWMHNLIYPGTKLYDWFLMHENRLKK